MIPVIGYGYSDDHTSDYYTYSKNYQKGYEEGYTYNGGGIKGIPPIPPIAPIPRIGESNQDAYTRGILEGQRAKSSDQY